MQRHLIIDRIKMKLDEYTPSGVEHPLDAYISPMLDEAVKILLREAPANKLRHDIMAITRATQHDGIVSFPVSNDVVRLISIKLPLWPREVTVFYEEGSAKDAWQRNEFTRAGMAKPVVIVSQGFINNVVDRKATCYTHSTLTNISDINVTCIKYRDVEQLHDEIIEAVVFLCASLVAQTIERNDSAKVLYENYQNQLK